MITTPLVWKKNLENSLYRLQYHHIFREKKMIIIKAKCKLKLDKPFKNKWAIDTSLFYCELDSVYSVLFIIKDILSDPFTNWAFSYVSDCLLLIAFSKHTHPQKRWALALPEFCDLDFFFWHPVEESASSFMTGADLHLMRQKNARRDPGHNLVNPWGTSVFTGRRAMQKKNHSI